jgi:BclB C-terminal domain-containing protein
MNMNKYIYELYNGEDSDYDYGKHREFSEYKEDRDDREWRKCKEDKHDREWRKCKEDKHDWEWKKCKEDKDDWEWRKCKEDKHDWEWRKCKEDKDDKECRECECKKHHHHHHHRVRSSASIIPFASGGPITLVTSPPNLEQKLAAIAFGNNASVVASPTTGDIILTPTTLNMAFSMPRFGIISSIAAYFSITSDVTIPTGSTVTVRAQLYESTAPNDTFTPIAGTLVTLVPSFSGSLIPGNRAHAILSNLRIPVRPETRLLLVFSAVASPNTTQVTLIGQASAGISIR